MGIASGVAAALARTATPVGQTPVTTTPAYILTGEPLPPELTVARYLTEWRLDLLWMLVVAFLAFFYLAGVWRLHRRGDRWPIYRTALWLAGLAAALLHHQRRRERVREVPVQRAHARCTCC